MFSQQSGHSGGQAKKKPKQVAGKSAKPTKPIDDNEIIDAVAELHTIVNQQRAEINELKNTVQVQQAQIQSLLTLFGLTGPASDTTSSAAVATDPLSSSLSSSAVIQTSVSSTQHQQQQQPGTSTSSYANVASHNALPLAKQLKHAVVTAVYRDLEDRGRRSKNIVISGLQQRDGVDDSTVASQFIENEFDDKPEIAHSRRLGKPQPSKVQPLLVCLKSSAQASHYIENAKRLRQSNNADIRQSVFINADITKAEAQAAYQSRCERRQRAEARNKRQSGTSSSSGQRPPEAVPPGQSSSSSSH